MSTDIVGDNGLTAMAQGVVRDGVDRRMEAILQERIHTLKRSVENKDATIQANRSTIAYMDQQVKRLRDVCFILRFVVAELKGTLEKYLIPMPHIMQEYPNTDETLEDSQWYHKLRKETIRSPDGLYPNSPKDSPRKTNFSRRNTREEGKKTNLANQVVGPGGAGGDPNCFRTRGSCVVRATNGRSVSESPKKRFIKKKTVDIQEKRYSRRNNPDEDTESSSQDEEGKRKERWNGILANSLNTNTKQSEMLLKGGHHTDHETNADHSPDGGSPGGRKASPGMATTSGFSHGRKVVKMMRSWHTKKSSKHFKQLSIAGLKRRLEQIQRRKKQPIIEQRADIQSLKPITVVKRDIQDNQETTVVMDEQDLTSHSIFAFEAAPVLQSLLFMQLDRVENHELVSHLLGDKLKNRLGRRCTKMMLEVLCLYLVAKNVGHRNELALYLPQWLQMVTEITQSIRGCIYIYDEQTDELVSRCITGEFKTPIRIKSGTGVTGQVFQTGRAMILNQDEMASLQDMVVDRRTKLKTRNLLCVPIWIADTKVGCLELRNKRQEPIGQLSEVNSKPYQNASSGEPHSSVDQGTFMNYTESDLQTVMQLCEIISPGLSRAPYHMQARQYAHYETKLMTEIITGVRQRKLHPLLREVMKPVSEILGSERSTLFLGDKKNGTLYAIVAKGNEDIMIEIPEQKGIAGSVYTSGIPLNITDCYSDPRFAKQVDKASEFQTKTMLCSPIRHMHTGESLGVIQAINKVGGNFTAADETRAQHLCEIVAHVLIMTEALTDIVMTAELSERLFQILSVATIVFNSFGMCTKANREIADLFFLDSRSSTWIGKHASDLFSQNNPTLYLMWETSVSSNEEQLKEPVSIFPYLGEAEATLRSVRVLPYSTSSGKYIGTIMTFSPTALKM